MSDENKGQEQQEETVKTYTQSELDDIVGGLKSNNQKLLSEKKEAQEAKTQEQETSRLAQEETARKNNDLETLESSMRAAHGLELGKLSDTIAARDKVILGERTTSAVNDLSGSFLDTSKELGKTILKSMVSTQYNDEGQPVTVYKDQAGEVLTTDISVFNEYLKTNDAFKPLLKGVQMDGGGATGSTGGNGGANTPKSLKDCYENGVLNKAKERAYYQAEHKKLIN